MIIIDIASLFKQYMQQITQCKYYSFVWAPIRLGSRATAPSAPPLIRHCPSRKYSDPLTRKNPRVAGSATRPA